MSAPTLIRRELKNTRIRFIPTGETVDTVTVSKTTWPDAVPTTNWTAYDFPDIEGVTQENEIRTEVFMIPDDAGDYFPDHEETVISRKWKAKTSKTNSYLKMLEHGLATVPTSGAAQTPGVRTVNNFLTGVALIETQNKNGTVIERTQVWAKLRLVSPGEAGPATTKIEFSLEQQPSGNNTFVAYA